MQNSQPSPPSQVTLHAVQARGRASGQAPHWVTGMSQGTYCVWGAVLTAKGEATASEELSAEFASRERATQQVTWGGTHLAGGPRWGRGPGDAAWIGGLGSDMGNDN